jgi:uncharacterized protein YeaO (DUF488 family)
MVKVKRVYVPFAQHDGRRFLVDRICPRGIKKEDLKIEEWLKDLAPSSELRKWCARDPSRWFSFRTRYREELKKKNDIVETLANLAMRELITLLYATEDIDHNNATILRK